MKTQRFTLYEGGYPHTKGLKEKDAKEMAERYRRFFPDVEYYYLPDGMMA
jgi:hypothetical protein